jgi:hypothetical protein
MKKFVGPKAIAVVAIVTGVVGMAFSAASADAVDTGFSSASTAIVGYLGDAIALILAVFILGLGIRMLIKWAHRAVAAT